MKTGDLSGLTVVITGAASGIGRAMAVGFRNDGATVVGGDIAANHDALAEVCDVAIDIDVTSMADNERLVNAAVNATGRVDAFMANAGISSPPGRFERQAIEPMLQVLRVNVEGVLLGIKAVLPVMRSQGHGRIVATASRNAENCTPGAAAYNASKAAVIVAVRTISLELAGTNILVNNLIPGVSASSIWQPGFTPPAARDPALAYPTARFLATLPEGGPSGETYFDLERCLMWRTFDEV